jgi:hypothetical protein
VDRARETGRYYAVPEPGQTWSWGFVFVPAEQRDVCCEPAPATVAT